MIIALIIIIVIVALLAIWVAASYNGFVKLRNKTEEAFSAMDVSLKKRYDLIPNFVETVKGYAAHESATLEKVIVARNMAVTSRTPEETIKNDNILSDTLKSLFALSENYPDLKANQNFLDLQNQLSRIEEEIAGSGASTTVWSTNTIQRRRCFRAIWWPASSVFTGSPFTR